MEMTAATAAAFGECERIARSHYENFTLGSRLLPRRLRRHIAAIYAFARTADDLADDIAYRDIPQLVASVMDAHEHAPATSLDVLLEADRWARDAARRGGGEAKGRAAVRR